MIANSKCIEKWINKCVCEFTFFIEVTTKQFFLEQNEIVAERTNAHKGHQHKGQIKDWTIEVLSEHEILTLKKHKTSKQNNVTDPGKLLPSYGKHWAHQTKHNLYLVGRNSWAPTFQLSVLLALFYKFLNKRNNIWRCTLERGRAWRTIITYRHER